LTIVWGGRKCQERKDVDLEERKGSVQAATTRMYYVVRGKEGFSPLRNQPGGSSSGGPASPGARDPAALKKTPRRYRAEERIIITFSGDLF